MHALYDVPFDADLRQTIGYGYENGVRAVEARPGSFMAVFAVSMLTAAGVIGRRGIRVP